MKRPQLYQLNINASYFFNFKLSFELKLEGLQQSIHFYRFELIFGLKLGGLQQNQDTMTPSVSIEWQC